MLRHVVARTGRALPVAPRPRTCRPRALPMPTRPLTCRPSPQATPPLRPPFLARAGPRAHQLGSWHTPQGARRCFSNKRIRNVGIIAHVDAGKTTTTERMLFYSKKIWSLGEVDHGDTHMDFLEQERDRGITIQSACTTFPWRDHQINLIDTPGHVDFTCEVERAVRVLDGAVGIFDGVKGVEAQTETVWKQADRYQVPRVAFVNKMDREGASLSEAVATMHKKLPGCTPMVVHYPLTAFDVSKVALVDLVKLELIEWDLAKDEDGGKPTRTAVPKQGGTQRKGKSTYPWSEDQLELTLLARGELVEQVADLDAILADAFLDADCDVNAVTGAQLEAAIRRVTLAQTGFPVLCGSSLRNTGVQPLLDAILAYLPGPLDIPPVEATLLFSATKGKKGKGKRDGTGNHGVTDTETLLHRPVDSEPLLALAFKVVEDSFRGPLVFVRVYSGVLRTRDILRATPQELSAAGVAAAAQAESGARKKGGASGVERGCRVQKEKVSALLEVNADSMEEVASLSAGNIGAVVGLKDVRTGDTLTLHRTNQCLRLPGIAIPEPVFFCSIEAASSAEQALLESALAIVQRDDPSVVVTLDADTGQTLLKGMGELHLEIVTQRLAALGLKAEIGKMMVSYRETLTGQLQHTEEYKGTVAGKEAAITIELWLAPRAVGEGNLFDVDDTVAFSLSDDEGRDDSDVAMEWDLEDAIEAVRIGCLQGLLKGPLLGYEMSDVQVTLRSIRVHSASSPIAFTAAGAAAVQTALRGAGGLCSLLEPVMAADMSMPASSMGAVLSDLSSKRRADVQEVRADAAGEGRVVRAIVPLVELIGYSSLLRSITGGHGSFTMQLDGYRPVSAQRLAHLRLHPWT